VTLLELLARFEQSTRSGDQWQVRCPAHDDRRASLSLGEGDDGRLLLHCKAGCALEQILEHLALTMRDLFPARPRTTTTTKRIVATYDYVDIAGVLQYQVVRYDPKDFRQRRPNGNGGWTWNLKGIDRVLYRLPTLCDQPLVFIVEGERDADRLQALTLLATTNPGGAGKWIEAYTRQLQIAGVTHVVIIPDADAPGRAHAQAVATSCHNARLHVRILILPDVSEKGDVSDYLDRHTREDLRDLVQTAPVYPPVDALVPAVERPRTEAGPRPMLDLVAILNRILGFIQQFMILTLDQATAIVLWTAHTHVLEAFDCTPYLSVTSPVKRSGKTRLFEVLEPLVCRPWLTGRVSAAVLVRKTDAEHPTLLLDESDTALKIESEYSEALRGLLNTGYRRSGKASLCVGQGANITYRDFSTFSPKALAGIGKIPDTVADRAIPIVLKRRTRQELVQRWRAREASVEAASLRAALVAWAASARDQLRAARPALPDRLGDRQADVWEPLLAIADLAGDPWPAQARHAAVTLAQVGAIEDEGIGLQLLEDIRQIFRAEKNPTVLLSKTLLEALHALEDRPWKTFGRSEKPISGVAMANLLRPFGVVSAGTLRIGVTTGKGYRRAAFLDAWKRYLGRFKPSHRNKSNKTGPRSPISDPSQPDKCDGSKAAVSPMNTGFCYGVTGQMPETKDPDTARTEKGPWTDL
jgi:Protein of unknown function (DUF3631)